jgi:hypothetical protein
LYYLFILIGALLWNGCEDNKDPAGLRGIGIVPGITDVNPAIFDSKDLENSYVEFKVLLEEGMSADGGTIVVSYNGDGARVEIATISSFPSTIRISSQEAASKLGVALADINNGDVFTFEVLIKSGSRVNASNSVLNVSVACAFNPALTVGTYAVVSLDWNASGQLTVTADPEDPYTIYVQGLAAMEGVVEDQGPLVMHINPLSYEVIADKTVIATDYFGYDNGAFAGKGIFNSCDGSYTMNFAISVDQGDFGTYLFVMTRTDL